MQVIYGREVEVEVGSVILPDGWRLSGKLEDSQWDGAQFKLSSQNLPDVYMSVNVKVTGRTFQRIQGEYWVRVQIEFVHDGEPSLMHGGYMLRTW